MPGDVFNAMLIVPSHMKQSTESLALVTPSSSDKGFCSYSAYLSGRC